MGDGFSIVDCAAAPALSYATTLVPFGPEHRNLAGYLDRLVVRPSFARVLEEAKPYFQFYPNETSPARPRRSRRELDRPKKSAAEGRSSRSLFVVTVARRVSARAPHDWLRKTAVPRFFRESKNSPTSEYRHPDAWLTAADEKKSAMTDAMDNRKRWLALLVALPRRSDDRPRYAIVNVALPSIRHGSRFLRNVAVWVVNAYMLTFGGFLLLGGRLGDLFEPKALLIGIVLFTLASLLCGIANRRRS